jgi:hypothetical protein
VPLGRIARDQRPLIAPIEMPATQSGSSFASVSAAYTPAW